MSTNALRVLGFTKRNFSEIPAENSDIENNLIFMGLVGMIDPPRSEVDDAIQKCHNAKITTIMITGDHQTTAVAIARKLGIFQDGDHLITGSQLNKMSDS